MHFTIVSLGWINLRCVNYSIDSIDDEKMRKITLKNLLEFTSYCLYLPTLYLGPIILYSNFRSVNWWENNCLRIPLMQRFQKLIFNLLRFIFWYFALEFLLHFLYVSIMSYNIDLLREINYFSLFGVGFIISVLFHIKYLVFYGLATCLTQFELDIAVPRTPKCVCRTHLFSDIWRYFDRGLYLFLIKYVFKPSAKMAGKLVGSLVCFSFIFLWHGVRPHILIWTILNYVGICFETFGAELAKSEDFKKKILKDIDEKMLRRLICLACAPLYGMSCLSGFYFGTGREAGDIFVDRLLSGKYCID